MPKSLIIIGNGFDKSINLPSSYSDFSRTRIKEKIVIEYLKLTQLCFEVRELKSKDILTFVNKFSESLFTEISLWEMLLLNKFKPDDVCSWYNIEKVLQLKLCVQSFKVDPGNTSNKDVSFINLLKLRLVNIVSYSAVYEMEHPIRSEIDLITSIFHAYATYHSRNNTVDYTELDYRILRRWEQFLIDQLNIFEKTFCNYLLSQVTDDYSILSSEKIDHLISHNARSFNLLNFNYTQPSHKLLVTSENVHGKLSEKNIIFGIDSKYTIPGSLEYSFSKEYRKSLLYFENPYKSINNVLSEDIDEIIIYGHSLNDQDLSYFYSIFDFYNLESSSRRRGGGINSIEPLSITYCFSYYNGKSLEEVREESLKSLTSLIAGYANRNNLKENEKNYLLTKLLLQNRFKIKIV